MTQQRKVRAPYWQVGEKTRHSWSPSMDDGRRNRMESADVVPTMGGNVVQSYFANSMADPVTDADQPPVLAVLGSILIPLLRAFSGTSLRTRFIPSDLFRISGCRIGPVPTCPLFLHFRSPSGTIPVGTTYTTTKPSDIDVLAHPKLLSTRSPLQT